MTEQRSVPYNPIGLLLVGSASLELRLKLHIRGQEVVVEIPKAAQLIEECRRIREYRFVAK